MTPRKVLFWMHLIAGCTGGIVILLMSLTGALLGYKKQILRASNRSFEIAAPSPGARRLPMEELLARVQVSRNQMPSAITVRSEAASPVAVDFGRDATVFVDPYSGNVLGQQSPRLQAFFTQVEDLHRWLAVSEENRETGRAITGACTLGFVFLTLTGPWLWWPKEWTWTNLKKRSVLRGGRWGRALHWNWHHALGIWSVAPLFLIALTGVIMSYTWANNLLYTLTGNTPPAPISQLRVEGPARAANRDPYKGGQHAAQKRFEGLGDLLARAEQQVAGWRTIGVRLPRGPMEKVTFSIDTGDGGRPDLRSQVTLDAKTGTVVSLETFSGYNRGRQLRMWARFTHTGEVLGVAGQTIATLATVAACLLMITGITLTIYRFASPKSGPSSSETKD